MVVGTSRTLTNSASMSFPNAQASSSSSSAPSQADLAAHPNVSFDQTTRKWTFESPDTGAEFEFNELSRTWVPVVRPHSLPSLLLALLVREQS